MITFYKRNLKDVSMQKLENYETFSWINIVDPLENDLQEFAKLHNLDFDLLVEGLDPNELPRIEIENKITYTFVKATSKNKYLSTLLIVTGENFLITISKDSLSAIDKILENKYKIITTQIMKSYLEILWIINEEMEKKVLFMVKAVQKKKPSTILLKEEDIEFLLETEDFMNNLSTTYNYTSHLYSRLMKNLKFKKAELEMLEDLIVESEQGYNLSKASLKTISNIRNYYSIVNANKLNRTIRVLTIFTVLMSVPASIGAIYGMNVKIPLENNEFVFYYISFIIFAIMGSILYYLKKKEWY
jgi:Mg2+ and Co2+ transporter CorA